MQINESEVEQWMIRAVTAQLMDAKMDQSTGTVIIK
jgi:hypothetical protein